MPCQMFAAEGSVLDVEFYYEMAVETAEDPEDDVEDDFEEVPVAVVGDLEEDEFAGAEGVHGLVRRGVRGGMWEERGWGDVRRV